jgi:hypothetical protein
MPWGIAAAGAIGGIAQGAGGSAASAAQAAIAREQLEWTKKVYGNAQKDIKPYTHLGEVSAKGYESSLPYLTSQYGMEDYKKSPLYTPMVRNLAELQATPGYQFQLQQGLQGVQQSAASKGGLLSGAAGQAMNNYAQGQAAQGYQSAWERAQKAYGTAFTQDLTQKAQIGTMYLEPAKLGQNSVLGLGQIGVNAATAMQPAYQALGEANALSAAAPWGMVGSVAGAAGGLFGSGGPLENYFKGWGQSGTVPGGVNFNSNTSGYTGASGWPQK